MRRSLGWAVLCSGLSACGSVALPPVSPETPQSRFVAAMLPHAAPAAEKLGVAPELIVAHAALESGWGRRPLRHPDGRDSHNLFSLKAGAGWTGEQVAVLTTEFIGGRKLKRVERFRAYPSFAAAFDDYAGLLGRLPRYHAVQGSGEDMTAFACALRRGGYATDPDYAVKLKRVGQTLRTLVPTSAAST